jgi:parallel beta-helix repeat protein
MRILTIALACAVFLSHGSGGVADEPREIVVTEDYSLPANETLTARLVIAADHVTIDGAGCTLQGPGRAGEPESFQGVAIQARGCSHVTLRNVKASGFASGLVVEDGRGWKVEECDFSDNYHSPEAGWGEGPRAGGILLTQVYGSVFRDNRANRVWNGIDLLKCDGNLIEDNDFSHCSNVCLKLYTATNNRVLRNSLSYGLRIDREAGEVHARDSTCVLIESGSDGNYFYRNDITHGGDGIFIRVLNGWVSRHNVFVENDCSYANNNCVESWSPDNTYLRNTANHGSYGFWLGGSDHTVLIGNEAAYNGLPDGFHNAPEPEFEHGGIVIVGGSSSHSLIAGNHLHHNHGGGLVFRGDVASRGGRWRTHHWVVQQNRIEHNRFGVWGRWGDGIVLAQNELAENETDYYLDDVTNLVRLESNADVRRAPVAVLRGPERAVVGQPVVFDASESREPINWPLEFRWDLMDGTSTDARVEQVFTRPGFYRVGLTVTNGALADLGFRDVIVSEPIDEELGTEGGAARWTFAFEGDPGGQARLAFADDSDAAVGRTSVRIDPLGYPGLDATAFARPSEGSTWELSDQQELSFWIKAINPDITGWQDAGPAIAVQTATGTATFTPGTAEHPRNYLREPEQSESRWLWSRLTVPLDGDGDDWSRTDEGEVDFAHVEAIGFTFDSWGAPEFTVWLDGIAAR